MMAPFAPWKLSIRLPTPDRNATYVGLPSSSGSWRHRQSPACAERPRPLLLERLSIRDQRRLRVCRWEVAAINFEAFL